MQRRLAVVATRFHVNSRIFYLDMIHVIRNNALIDAPKITIANRLLVKGRDSLPQAKVRGFISISDSVSD